MDKYRFIIRAPHQPPSAKPKQPSKAEKAEAAARRRIEEIKDAQRIEREFGY